MTHDITLTRLIDAPPERIFDAWTNPASLEQWWGPHGFTIITESIDLRPGGAWKFVMRGPDGVDYPNYIIFDEIVEPQRITYSHGDTEGRPDDFYNTVTFEAAGKRTRLTIRSVFQSAAMREDAFRFGVLQGGHETLDKLTEFVDESAKTLVITRIINAPLERVWRALTEPELIRQWWGPEHFTSPAAQVDFRVGGKYLFAMRDPEGKDYWSTGVYREIAPMERFVYTDSFADAAGNVISPAEYGMGDDFPVETTVAVELEDLGGRTRLTLTNTGMPRNEMFEMTRAGWSTSLDKLAQAVSE
jgi:uncharacterized protein YndB with AHSA1/START domain